MSVFNFFETHFKSIPNQDVNKLVAIMGYGDFEMAKQYLIESNSIGAKINDVFSKFFNLAFDKFGLNDNQKVNKLLAYSYLIESIDYYKSKFFLYNGMLTNPFEIKHMIRNGDTEKITIFKDKKRMYLYDTLILFDKIIDVELYQATQQLSGINLSVKLVKT